jgi:hypothetical protein
MTERNTSVIEPGMEQSEIDDARNRGCVVNVHGTGQRWRFDKDNCFEVYRVFFCDVTDNPCSTEDMLEISS